MLQLLANGLIVTLATVVALAFGAIACALLLPALLSPAARAAWAADIARHA